MSDVAADIHNHLKGMAPHIRQRKTAELLRRSLHEIEQLRDEIAGGKQIQAMFDKQEKMSFRYEAAKADDE